MNTLKALRQRAGLLQRDVADSLGVVRTTIGNWEAGRREPNAAQMKQLCGILGCTAAELLGMEPAEGKEEEA